MVVNLENELVRTVGKVSPHLLWEFFRLKCAKAGMIFPKFLLTFDCDTEIDIEVVSQVHARLSSIGITPVYAVPGELIESGLDVYKALAELGVEFLNHGYVQHTHVDAARTRYVSTFFYDQIGRRKVLEDIDRGHETLVSKLGISPKGFRTPHFGTFQSKEDLIFLHEKLVTLGYTFSSSTTPLYSFLRGPSFSSGGITEIPVTGCPSWPLGILDSYNFRFSGSSKFTPEIFENEMMRALKMMNEGKLQRINMYADPSQVYDWDGFFENVGRFAPFAVANFSSYLEK
jgi:hypothetical protein